MPPIPPSYVTIETVTSSGNAAQINICIREHTVEIWRAEKQQAVFSRDHFRTWADDPNSTIRVNDVTFTVDRLVDHNGRIAITMPDIHQWALSPREQSQLSTRLQGK